MTDITHIFSLTYRHIFNWLGWNISISKVGKYDHVPGMILCFLCLTLNILFVQQWLHSISRQIIICIHIFLSVVLLLVCFHNAMLWKVLLPYLGLEANLVEEIVWDRTVWLNGRIKFEEYLDAVLTLLLDYELVLIIHNTIKMILRNCRS